MPDNVDKLFEIMQANGAANDRNKFRKVFLTPGNKGYKIRKDIYDGLRADGIIDSPTYEDFRRKLRLGGTPTVNKYRQQMFNSVDPNKNGLNALSHRAVSQAKRAMNNVRKPVTAKVVDKKGKPTGEEFAITPAKTVEDLDREYAQETTKNWENELHDQMADADKDAAKISDMFKSFIGSTDEVGSVWGNMTRGGGIAGTPHSVTTNNGILENTEARQLLAAGDYNRKRKELLQLEQDSRNGATFDNHSFFRGMYDAAKDTGILTGGASDLINAGSLLATKQDLDNGIHTEAGDMLMQQAVKNSDAQSQYGDNQGWMYTGGVITTNMAPFIVQIASAGFSKGLSTSIGKVVQGAASKVALGTMKKAAGFASADLAKNIGKVTGLTTKAFGKAIQYGIVGAAQANTVGLGNVANDVINRYTGQVYQDEQGNYKFGTFDSDGKLVHEGGEDFLTAFVKGEAAQTIEFATELAGGGIDAAGTALKNFVTKGGKKIINKYNMENVSKVINFLLNNKVAKNARYLKAGADRTLGKVELNSIVGESLEEELGIIANTVFTGDNKISDLWDEKQQSQIWGGMLLSIGLMKGAVAPFHAYNAKQYYSYKHKLNKADVNLSQLLGKEKWEGLRNQIDATTNEDMPEMVNKINRDVALGKNRQPVREYIQNLLIMRGYDIGNMLAAKKAVEDKGEGVSVKNMEKNQAYQQGRDAYGYDTHEIQLDQEDKQKSLAQLLGISEQQLVSMSDEELEELSGRDDNIDRAIYDYQLSSARYEGVVDNARDQIDLEVQRAAQAVDMYTDKSRNTIRNATIKASGGLEDYGVYIISGNIATHDDGSIDVSNSDDMILYYDPTTNTVEHADAMMFAELGSEENADEVRSQAMADAKEKAIKETTGIIDGVVEVGTQFKTVDADGTEHTYEVLADNGDGTAMITIDGNIPTELVKGENVQVPVSFEELQKMKDESDQQRLQAAKAEREQMEKERAEQQMQAQTTQAENPTQEDNIQSTPIEDNIDYSDIIREDGKVQMVDVSDKDGNNLFPDAKDVFYIQGNRMRTKFVYIDANGELKTQSFPTGLVKIKTRGEVSVDDYKKYRNTLLSAESSAIPESSMIEDNSGENRGEIEAEPTTIEDETTPEVAENTETTAPADETAETPSTEQTPAITLEDGTIVPMLEDGNPDFSKLTAAQTAELYDNQFGEDADSIVSGYVSDAKKALDKANNMTVKGKTFLEQKASKDAKEKAIADAQAAYDSAIAIRDAYNERQLAKVEDTAEGRKNLIEKARRKFARLKSAVKDDAEAVAQIYKETVGTLLHRLYDGTGIDVTDTIPLTAEEYVASNLGAHSLNYEGTETSKSVKQETGLSREDFAKTQLLAADGKGTTIDALVHSLWENRPSNLDSLDTQDIRNALIGVLTSGFKASEARSFIENIRIAQAEKLIEEERTAAENAAYYEQQKAKEEEEKKKAELEKKAEEEKKKAEENIDLPAIDKQGEPINNNIIELAKWAKKQGLEIDPTSKLNSYADLFLMCKDGFGVSTLVPDEGKNINQVIYFPDNAEVVEQLGKLQEEFNAGRDLNHSSNIDSEITEGATFYDAATAKEFRDFANEQTKFPDTLREGSNAIEVPEDSTDENPLGLQLSEDKVPFEIEGGKSGETYNINDDEDRQRLINDNKVDDKDILDIDMPKHVHKAIKELCKKMGLKVQFLYMGARSNGWIENGTMYLALDTEKATQFVFGHEMTHAIKQKNPEAYKELVKVAMAVTTKKKFEEDLAKVYQNYHGILGYNNVDDYVEEVIADNIGKFINDHDLAQRFVLRLNHPVLATILHAIQKIKGLLYGDPYKSVDALERIVEKAYVDTANGQVINSETGEDVSFSLRQKPEPKKKGIGYKVFVLKDGKLYPPMVANPNGAATPVGVWLDADAAPIAGESKTGRPQVKQGGKGTQGGSGKLAYRPGWHLGVVPYAIQFNRKDAEGNKTLFPKNFVFAEVEYAADVDYQEEARQEGINPSGKYQHSLAGLKHLPTDGYYMYRTNPNPETDPWVITGAMKVNRILTRAEQADLVSKAGREPQQIQEGDIVTDDVVNSINQEIADAPKFSIKTYHGSQASFDKFDHSFMGSGEGAQAYGWGTYVSEVEGIAKAYAKQNAKKNAPSRLMYQDKPMTYKTPSIIYQVAFNMDKFNISAKEAISQMIDAGEKKLASVDDTPFAKMKAKQVQDELNVLKGLNPSDFKINEDYDTVAQNLADTKSGLDLLEDELKDAKSYVDLYQSRLDEAKGELSKAKESGTGLGVDMYESDVMYYSEQVEKYKQNVKTKESDIKDVKTKIDALQKKLDSIGKPRNLYSVDIPDDTGDNYIGWDEPITPKMLEAKRRVMEEDGYTMYDSDGNYDYFEKTENGKYQYWQLWNRQKGNGLYSELSKVLHSDKLASLALNKQGIVGVKVIADRTTGGNKEGKMNYVIFDENNAQITNHTKFSLRLKSAIEETETNPSDAQKESGNYKKGHIKFGGYDYTIENPKGSTRSGKDANGKEWKVTMHDTYGYIRGKFGKDGDHLDMFINDKADLDNWDGDVFVVDQVNPDGSFDEHKVMYGYDSMDDAEKAYLANYSKGWKGLGNITGVSKDEFDKWLDTSKRKLKPFKDYAKVKFSLKDNQGNPLNQDGTLKLDKIKSVDELTDEDFLHPTRNVELPSLPKKIADAIGTEGKPVVIKKNIFERNYMRHKDVTPELSKVIFKSALYNPDLYGQNQKKTRPYNWVLINTKDEKGNNRTVLLEVNPNKDNVEIVHWHFVNDKNLGLIKKQAIREGDQVLILPSEQSEEVGGLSNLTDDLSAAKIDNSSETAKENGEKFSLKDEKTLAGVHNITEEKLRKALKLGGFANPSLAVIDTNKSGHDNFGEISFIAPSALVDKRTGKTAGTWITDAYTQRYPSVERQMSEKGSQKFEDWVDSLEYPSAAKAEIKRQTKDVMEDNGVPAWELMYLKEKGIDIKAYDSRIDYRWKEIINDHPTAEDILSSMQNDPELNEKVTSLAKHAIIHPTWEKVSLEVRRKMYKETGVKASPINPQVRKQTKEIFERDYKSTLLNKDGSPRKKDVKKVVEDIVKEHNDTKKYDFYLSKVKASNYVNKNGLYDDYIRWQENKLDEFGTKNRIFRGYTKDGSRKYVPETLENVSKAMREEADGQTNGSEYTSFGSFIAKLASRVDSTDEMRANKDKLSSNEDKEAFYEKWSDVYYDLAKFLYNDVFYGEQRLHDIVLQSDPKKYAKKEYGITLTPTFMKKLDALKNAVQTELKSAYFETKYNRPLRLNEFAAAVVPDNLGEDVRKGIEDAGLPMYDYDPNKEGDRSRAFNEAINSSDNIRFSLKAEKEKIVADAKSNGTYMTAPNGEKTKLDAEQWATVRTANFKNWFGDWENDPENASKVVDENGEPMVMYHYTDESFTIFGKDKEVGKNTFGNATNASYAATTTIGHWFTSNKKQPEYMGKPMACFLNIVEPFDGYTLEGLADYLNNYISDEDFNSYEEDYENVAPIIEAGNNFREEQIRDGYDGVVIDDEEFGGTSYVAFNANQIKSAENNNGDFSADNNDIRFSLAGERGAAAADKAEERTARMDFLSVARKMEEEKKDAKAIKMATGWERGADGKWRYEMPDAKIKDTMDVGGGQIVKRYEEDMLWNGGKLSKVIDAPELFKAYPQLKDVRIETDAIMNDMPSNGEYNAKTNTITIHADELKYMNSILNHEIQHAIQSIEGFDRGGSPRLVRGEIKKRLAEVTKQIRQLRAEGKEDEAKAIVEKNRGLYNAYQANDDYNSYKSLAGEVEARNVSARINMTPEERRKTLAESTEDVARKDQIFLGVGDVSFSLRDMADGKESGAADMAEDLKSLNTPDEVDDAIKTAIDDMPSGWQMANRKMIHIAQALGENRKAEIAGEEPKFSLKDGTLIKAGTYFSGGGLVEEGLKGIIDPVVAVEYDEKISGVYRNNFGQHIVTADVRDVDPKELVKQIDGEVEYFHASPVCKNYSQAKSNHAELELDKETAASTAEFINAIKPKVVTIENVKGYKDSEAMKTITDALDANGYTWDADVYNAADYGGYTNRERLIVRAVRDGKLPDKPKKMAHKSGWYEAVADIIPTLTEKKNGVAPWMDIRLKADGIDWRNIDKPLYVMGSAYADGKIPHAFADELLPTLRTKSGDVIVMPDGKVYRAMGRVLARVSGVSDDYKMPFSENLSHTIIGNGIPTQLTEHVIAPLLQNTLRPTTPEDGNTKFSLRGSTPYDKQMEEWMEKNHLEKGAVPMEKPVMKEGENIFDYANRMVEWTRNQNLWKTAPKQTGFQDALDKWKADNGLSPDAYPPVRPHRENYSTEIGYTEDLEEYNKKKELWKSAPKPKDFDLSVDLEDMNKQLRNIRRAVLNQKNYDQRTVKAVSDLVRKMLNIGWGDGLSRGKVGNLLSAAKNATGSNDVKKYLDKAMGILAENYLNRLSTAYDNLINTKGARADQSGVIKMGSLDAKGQAFMSEYKKAINMDDKSLNTYIANIEEDSAKNEDNVEMNDYRLAGIQAAIMYKQQIGGNDADISELKRQIGELKNKKDATKEDKDLLKSLEKKLFENKFDRITMYENLLNNIQRMVKESKGRAKEFREEIAEHKNEILHRANLDLEGVDSTYYDTTTAKKKFVNNDLQRAVFSSTYTFEQFLKFFGKHSANGEGRLYNYFHKLNQDALDEEQLYNEMNRNALDEKTKELFGKNKFMNLVGIDGKGMKEMDVEVTDYSNKETGKRTIHLKQGQMLYIYLVNKETDGEMKLRAMGITEEDVAAIEENLDPRVKAMGEWLQDEYLPECQRRYQATHTKYFGAPMKEVENYFPLAINNRARNVKEDVNQDSDAMSQLAGTSTGAIVTRRVNVIPLDIENADAFEVAFNHLQEMEEWSAMLPFRQDINTLLSYTHFRNQVQNMSSVAYGSGKTLWDEFKQTAQIAAGTYKPKVNAGMMDSRIAAAMGGIAVAKISGRLWTAIKQSQSATVFLPECDFTRFVKNGVNPYGSWKWAMENIPDFRKRVENMTYGDVKLRQYLDELEKWHDWTKTISKIGMAPNILVDGITCAVGARSVYETEVNRLTKLGYPKEKAEEKAYYKAVAAYNKTQQSSGGMYLSPMQVDRTYVSAALSLFKNANYAYGRMQIEACRGLARTYDFWGGKHKTTLIESMTRQIMEEDGLDENTARAIAKATYNRTFRQSIGRLINFATLVPVSWALYKVLPYLLTGDDDDKKNDMIEEAVLKGFATSLSDNYVIPFASNILNAGLKVEDGKPTFDPEVFRYQNLYINPATSDLANIYSMVGNQKWYSVANKLGMLGVQSLIGFNPETVGALYQALSEADYDNGNTAKEWQIGILKAISAPEESIRELYMDELGLKSGDIKKIPLAELEKRYAERQINRDNLLSQVFMDAEDFNGYVDKYQKSFEKKIKDKMDKWDEYDKKKADEFFDTTSDPKLKDMIEKKRAKDANAAADEQIAKEGLNQEKNGKEPSEKAYDAVKMSIDVAEDNAISTYNKVLNKRYAALNDEYNNQTDAMKYIFMSKHPNFKAYKELESEYTNYGKKIKELKEKLVSADGYDAKQTILKQIRAEREKFSELQSKVR